MPDYKNEFSIRESLFDEEVNIEWEITDFYTNGSLIEHSPIFSFAKDKWMLCLSRSLPSCMWLKISNVISNNELGEKWECSFGAKKINGDLFYFPKDPISFAMSIPRFVFFQLRHVLTFSNNLTIVCTLQHVSHSVESSASREYAPLKQIKFDALSQNFRRLFSDRSSCDVILRVKEKVLNAHRAVLMARSPVFAAMFHHDTLEKQTGIVNISDCDPDSFQKFLRYLYSGELDESSFHNIYHLYKISDKYDVQDLKCFCTEHMKKCLTEDNMCDIVMLADMYDGAKLFSAAQDFFNRNAYKVMESAHWENFLKNNYVLANRIIKGMIRNEK